jgi:hypothetical protein
MDPIYLLDDSLQVEIFYEKDDGSYTDNICMKIIESCIEEEKVFRHDENHLYLTPEQAKALAEALTRAVQNSEKNN